MKIKCFKYILYLLFFTFLFKSVGFAVPYVGNIYGAAGAAYSKNEFSCSITSNIKDSFKSRNNYNNNINLAFGIASNLPLPIIDSLRLELNYIQSLTQASNKILGASFYYDIKILPFLVPYLGVSLFSSTSQIVLKNSSETIKEKINQGLTSFNVGANIGLPLFPLSVFTEYKYAIPGIFKNNVKFKNNDINYNNHSYHVSIFTVGIRYYFL